MKLTLLPFVAGLILLVPMGCMENDPGFDDQRYIIGTGPVITKNLTLDAFSKIENTGVANITVHVGGQ